MKLFGSGESKGGSAGMNARMMGKLLVIAVLMFGFGFALVPIYKKVCEITGVNILTLQSSPPEGSSSVRNTQVDLSRTITVELDANAHGPWRFRPTVNQIQVHPGEMAHVVYEVVNKQARTINAQAIPSYAPQQAAPHFKKVECFCFQQQTLKPNEAREMPVVFYVDRDLPTGIKTITLSYTFFEIDGSSKKPG